MEAGVPESTIYIATFYFVLKKAVFLIYTQEGVLGEPIFH